MNNNSSSTTTEADAKISGDLRILTDKMDLLETLLNPRGVTATATATATAAAPKLSARTDDTVRSVAGYLDACGPRMIELVTACTATHLGVLSESVFGEVLECNDRLQKLLAEFDARLIAEMEAELSSSSSASASAAAEGAAAAAAAASSSIDLADQFGDLLLGNEDPFAQAHGSGSNVTQLAGAKTTGETSEDSKPAAASAVAPAPAPERDPFDDFFAERTENSGF
eukprot:jgi/Psemu1/209184/e_gw1.491.1.1